MLIRMFAKSNLSRKLIVVLVFILAFSIEVECRRKILRGRKLINRTYMRQNAVPAYVVVILVAIGQIIIGALLYVLLKICILDKPLSPRYHLTQPTDNDV
ncbi:unnamed protein product [Phyllotreta striolata]|uniref:Uncharacterized protein n=1 Tax=Phyllotreta striolata TaxID=444603 RepID=A0A9N9XTJ9_PHYSR|nr:unnamed protein product [Phyllotreta striolata]